MDCSVISTIQLDNPSMQALRAQVESALGTSLPSSPSSLSTESLTTASTLDEETCFVKLQEAWEQGQLPSLKAVGWEANERSVNEYMYRA